MKCCEKGIWHNNKRSEYTVGMKLVYVDFIMATILFAAIGSIAGFIAAFIVIAVALFRFSYGNTLHFLTTKMVHERRSAYCNKQMCR